MYNLAFVIVVRIVMPFRRDGNARNEMIGMRWTTQIEIELKLFHL